jgi:predicted alpha/beta hydrolase family esterase
MSYPSRMRVVIFHGYGATAREDLWYYRVAEDLRAEGMEVDLPQLPSPKDPRLEAWLETAHGLLSSLDSSEGVLVVGHSLGGTLILKLLEQEHPAWLKREKFRFLLLGSPTQERPVATSFYPITRWDNIEQYSSLICYLWSEDDPRILREHYTNIRGRLPRAQVEAVEGWEHFLSDDQATVQWIESQLYRQLQMLG